MMIRVIFVLALCCSCRAVISLADATAAASDCDFFTTEAMKACIMHYASSLDCTSGCMICDQEDKGVHTNVCWYKSPSPSPCKLGDGDGVSFGNLVIDGTCPSVPGGGEKTRKDTGNNNMAIIGGSIGGVVVVAAAAIGGYYWKKQQKTPLTTTDINFEALA
jgi:hypothetical protein